MALRAGALGRLTVCLVALAAGCGGGSQGLQLGAAAAEAVEEASARLVGTYRLVDFTPEVPLEPMLQSMLDYQYATMIVQFDGRILIADSPGVHLIRPYSVREAYGDAFKMISFDEHGVPYESTCEFIGPDELAVHSHSPPWRGRALLRRVSQ